MKELIYAYKERFKMLSNKQVYEILNYVYSFVLYATSRTKR